MKTNLNVRLMNGITHKSFAPAVGLAIALVATAYAQDNNIPQGQRPANIAPQSAQPTRGVVFFTAAINSDGTIGGCFGCNTTNTKRLGVGVYQIDFGQNIQAINGWSRWVQVDTLTTGTENAWCNTADRAGDSNAVWVNCQTSGGPGSMGNSKPVDASFFLFVAR
jgi:opacity protein-like surface antigen